MTFSFVDFSVVLSAALGLVGTTRSTFSRWDNYTNGFDGFHGFFILCKSHLHPTCLSKSLSKFPLMIC